VRERGGRARRVQQGSAETESRADVSLEGHGSERERYPRGKTYWSPILPSASSIEIGGSPPGHTGFVVEPRISATNRENDPSAGSEGARSVHGGIHAGAAKMITDIAKYAFGKG
jgi:hypothetical protein